MAIIMIIILIVMKIVITRSTQRAKPSLGECTRKEQTSATATNRYQNLMAHHLYHPQSFLKISSKSIHKFLSNMLRQTDKQATDRYQNVMARYLYHPQSFLKISSKSVHNFVSNPANRQTNTNLRQGHGSLPRFNGLLLVPSSISPKNFIKIHS